MKALLVFAHPDRDSFTRQIVDTVENVWKSSGITYTIRDLYQLSFQPVFTAEDMNRVEQNQLSHDIEKEQELVTEADLLVMVYPVWWWSQPAILKGWIDRVFTNSFAFHYTDQGPVGNLSNKQAIVFTSTRESAEELKAAGYDQVLKKQIVDGVLSFVGFAPVEYRNYAAVPYVSDSDRNDMLHDVEQVVKATIRMPVNA